MCLIKTNYLIYLVDIDEQTDMQKDDESFVMSSGTNMQKNNYYITISKLQQRITDLYFSESTTFIYFLKYFNDKHIEKENRYMQLTGTYVKQLFQFRI